MKNLTKEIFISVISLIAIIISKELFFKESTILKKLTKKIEKEDSDKKLINLIIKTMKIDKEIFK